MERNTDKSKTEEEGYVASLEYFLMQSNEDTHNIDVIIDDVQSHLNKRAHELASQVRILDIGSGNGAKTFYLIEQLRRLGFNPSLDVIEPKTTQRHHLIAKHQELPYPCLNNIYSQPLTADPWHEIDTSKSYDLVLLLHSLYEFSRNQQEIVEPLKHLKGLLASNGLGLIINEHPEGDFQRLKRMFYPSVGNNVPLDVSMILKTLDYFELSGKLGKKINYQFDICELLNCNEAEIGHNLSFLFSTNLLGKKLTDRQAAEIGRWIKNEAKHQSLYTPDQVIWFRHSSKPMIHK